MTPKEPGPGRGKKESDNNDSFSQKEKDRRWENAALAEFWEHPELNPRLGHNGESKRESGNCWGGPEPGKRTDLEPQTHAFEVARSNDRSDFRVLAKAFGGDCELTDDEWR